MEIDPSIYATEEEGESVSFKGMDFSEYDNIVFPEKHIFKSDIKQVTFQPGCKLPNIPINLFKIFPLLETLKMSGCQLKYLDQSMFENSDNLEQLDLCKNELTTLPNEVFKLAGNLKVLHVNFNRIIDWESNTFAGLGELTELALSGNGLSTLPEGIFDPLVSLEDIDLYWNKIDILPGNTFVNNSNLKKICLELNQISEIAPDTFTHLENIEQILVGFNIFPEITTGSVKELDIAYLEAELKLCFVNGSVENLNITSTKLGQLQIADYSKLKILKILGNPQLNLDFLQECYNLEELDMSDMELNELDSNIFKNLENLRCLDLSKNELKVLDIEIFNPLKNLENLIFIENNLTELNYTELVECLPKLKTIGFQSNNFDFSYMEDMLEFFYSKSIQHIPVFKNGDWHENPTIEKFVSDDEQ